MVAILDSIPLYGVGFRDASEAKETPILLLNLNPLPNYRGGENYLPLPTPDHAFTISSHIVARIPTLFIIGT